MNEQTTFCGYVAIIGRPNVGKSTLLNHILGQKISITSKKPQTTRHRILGIYTEADYQIIFVDTPGIHQKEVKAINRVMNRAATSSIQDVDLVLFVMEAGRWKEEDEYVLQKIKQANLPVLAVVNKVDLIKPKEKLLPYLATVQQQYKFDEIFPVSATKGINLSELMTAIQRYIPEGTHFFDESQITDRSSRFLAAEIVREKLMRFLGDELPYSVTVEIERFEYGEKGIDIAALILVEKEGQKRIVIGQQGENLKRMGTEARENMQVLFDTKVHLQLWVKVKAGWSDDERALNSLGYTDFE